MPLTAEQYASIATSYDKAAADSLIPTERRAEFARAAAWFRHLGELEAKRESRTQALDEIDSASSNPAEEMPTFKMKHLLTTLWLAGAVVYLVSTLLFTRAINLFGEDEQISANSVQTRPSPNVREPEIAASPLVKDPTTELRPSATARPHAILSAQPSYERANELSQKVETDRPAPSPSITQEPEVATRRLVSAASIRSGPSFSAGIIGTAAAGAELQITAQESDWVQFVDPSSGKRGWIHSSRVESDGAAKATTAQNSTKDVPAVEPAKPIPAKNAKKSSKEPLVSKSQPSNDRTSPKTYVELPPDDEFLPPKRRARMGILERRRMLRQGLMSPGFVPPR